MPLPVLSWFFWLRWGPPCPLPGPHSTSLPHLSYERHFLHLTSSVWKIMLPCDLEKTPIWYDSHIISPPPPHETLLDLQRLQDAAGDELGRPSAIWNLHLWILTFCHVAPIMCLGFLSPLSWAWQAPIIFQD